MGVKSYGYVSEYSITTDQSLLPFSENIEEAGVIIDNVFQVQSQEVFDDTYVNFYIYKSGIMWSYNRVFNKLDTFFSYIGGLFGAIMGGIFVMKSFTESAFELSIGERLYRYSKAEPLNASSFNFLTHLCCKVYSILDKLGFHPNWKSIRRYEECMEEVTQQLDVKLLMQRLVFMERAMLFLFSDEQFKGLHLQEKLTLKEAQ